MKDNNLISDSTEIKQIQNLNDLNKNETQIEKTKFESNIEMISKSRNYISKANFFSKSPESQSEISNDDTSCLTNKTSSHYKNFSNKTNPLVS
jgi:ribosomal protein S8